MHSSTKFRGRGRGRVEYYNGDEIVFCKCGEPCGIVTSWTEINPARKFHGCHKYGKHGACDFCLWYDPPMCKRTNNILAKLLRNLRNAETENKNLKLELSKLKAKGSALWIVLALSWMMVFVLLFEYARRNQGAPNFRMLE
ncbi:hypothetical protein ACH5RR_029875 [Cinchona calisaya]|uniref:Zinc finger GRF-type domain-containing protein n=1 Tax=Cinchona calisaya TaxID=153742 RepID=A0ABD2YW56_9GENT